MPLAFDVNRLKPSSYDLTQSVEMIRLQSTLTDFMTIVRDDQKALDDDQGLLNTFCNFIDDSSIWEHAYQVIPELHSSQYRDTSGPGPIDHILRELNYRLDPWPQNEEEELAQFKEFEQNQIRSDVRYIMTLGTGKATQNEKDEIDAMVEYQMLLRCESPDFCCLNLLTYYQIWMKLIQKSMRRRSRSSLRR